METKKTIDEITKLDNRLSFEKKKDSLLKSLKENNVPYKVYTDFVINNTSDNKDVYIKAHEEFFKDKIESKLKGDNKLNEDLTSKLGKILSQSSKNINVLYNKMKHAPTDKQLGNELMELLNMVLKDSVHLFKGLDKKEEKKEIQKLLYKKGDVVLFSSPDHQKIIAGKVVEDSYNKNETVLQAYKENKETGKIELLENKIAIKNTELTKFKFKNLDISFDELSNKNKLSLLAKKETDPIKITNPYKDKVDGHSVTKLYEQNVTFKLSQNFNNGKIKSKVFKPILNNKAYGMDLTKEDLEKIKKGNSIIGDAINKDGKPYTFIIKHNEKLNAPVIANTFNNSISKNTKYINSIPFEKADLNNLFLKNEATINNLGKNKNISLTFALASNFSQKLKFDTFKESKNKDIKKEKEVKESLKTPIKKKKKGLKL